MRDATLPLLAALAAVALWAGCHEVADSAEPTGEPPAAEIAANPALLEFGAVDAGSTATAQLILTSPGGQPLHLMDLSMQGSGNFALESISSVLVSPGHDTTLELSYSPVTVGLDNGTLHIESDAATHPLLEVSLWGNGRAPAIALSPSPLELGTGFVGCPLTAEVQVSNHGNLDLEISDANLDALEMAFQTSTDLGPLPWALAPEETRILGVLTYLPLDEEPEVGALTVTSNDPLTPEASLIASANGVAYGQASETFTAVGTRLDLVFAVNTADSMAAERQILLDSLPGFTDRLASRGLDFQLALVVRDDGCVNGEQPWIDNSHLATTTDVAATMLAGTPSDESARTLALLEAAVREGNRAGGGCNHGLLREDTALHLVGVSDARDNSGDWAFYVSLLQSIVDHAEQLTIHAIGGDYPGGCGDADPYDDMAQAVTATGGEFLSICALDETTMAGLADALADRVTLGTLFALSHVPVAETLHVWQDGQPLFEGWIYERNGNNVRFAAPPPQGCSLEMAYTVAGGC